MKPYIRKYQADATTRNARIEVCEAKYPFDQPDDPPYFVFISHESWTGVEWLTIFQREEAFSLERAFEIARSARDQLGWIPIP